MEASGGVEQGRGLWVFVGWEPARARAKAKREVRVNPRR